jgi:hypothetical protein
MARSTTSYDRHKNRARERQATQSRTGRDIAPLPKVKNKNRRAKACKSLYYFGTSYFPHRFGLPFCQDHLDLFAALEKTIVRGGLDAFAFPRGSGKTTIVEVAVIWAVLTGRRSFVVPIGSSQDAADEILQSIKTELESNDLLAEDFPEVCYPIAKLEGIPNRCKGQLFKGHRTRIKWSGSSIVLPSIERSKSGGAIIAVRGITGRIRGMKFTRPDGKTVRPDYAILDDPQTDESAASPTQTAKRLKLVMGAVLGLSGPGRKIAAAMPCTVIECDDLADQVLDRSKHPEWSGRRCKLVYQWPTSEEAGKLWDEYAEIRRRDMAAGGDGSAATKFYADRRSIMDAGSHVAWPARYEPGELSALQHAYNLRIKYRLTFDSEYQNEPRRADADSLSIVPKANVLVNKLSKVPRGTVPVWSGDYVTAFIDLQQDVLFYLVSSWSSDFVGTVIEYGTFPDQRRNTFTLKDLREKLRDKYAGANIDGALLAGLRALVERLSSTTWQREDGVGMPISRILIDGGYKNHIGYQVCRELPQSSILSYGRAIGPQNKPISDYEKKQGDQVGLNWMITRAVKRASRHVMFDANFWKSFVFNRFSVSPGDKGSLTLYGSDPQSHHLLAEHLTAEYANELESKTYGRIVTVFDLHPGRDNHWLDCLVGSAVGASIVGAKLPSIDAGARPMKKRLSLAEMAKQAGS